MKNKKYLEFYHKCLQNGNLPVGGLCYAFMGDDLFRVFKPESIFGDPDQFGYWGYDGKSIWEDEIPIGKIHLYRYKFTTLRQTIVLFLAAMNGEL